MVLTPAVPVFLCLQDRGIDASIFQNPCKLHMTLGTLALMSDSEISEATSILNDCQRDLIEYVEFIFSLSKRKENSSQL